MKPLLDGRLRRILDHRFDHRFPPDDCPLRRPGIPDPAAQFSVSKYQLIPQMGVVATMMATSGRPVCNPRSKVPEIEYLAWRKRMVKSIRLLRRYSISFASMRSGICRSVWLDVHSHSPELILWLNLRKTRDAPE